MPTATIFAILGDRRRILASDHVGRVHAHPSNTAYHQVRTKHQTARTKTLQVRLLLDRGCCRHRTDLPIPIVHLDHRW